MSTRAEALTEQQHTPGPWTVEEYGDEEAPALVIHSDQNYRICFMATPGSMGDPAKIEADANLIAAAPDMLAALRDVESKIVDFEAGRINWRPDDFLFRVRAAIAKARESVS